MKLHLRDTNAELTAAWRHAFEDPISRGLVEVSFGDILDTELSGALVSPANSFGFMDGGIDAVYLRHFGFSLQERVREAISREHGGELPVGSAAIVDTLDHQFPMLVVAPTMRVPTDVSGTINSYLAMRAALAVSVARGVATLITPGLATAVGGMAPAIAARQMRFAWDSIIAGKRHSTLDDAHRSDAALRGRPWALET